MMKSIHSMRCMAEKVLGWMRFKAMALLLFFPLLAVANDNARFSINYTNIISTIPSLGGNMTYKDGAESFLDSTNGLRMDKIAGAAFSGTQIVRFPGGTVVNTYRWKDAIGPQQGRLEQIHGFNTSGGSLPSTWGPDEAAQYAEAVGAELQMVVNFNDKLNNAADLVEYMNCAVGANPNGGTDWAAVRAANGHPAPYNVRYWEIGNESAGKELKAWPNWPSAGDDNETDGLAQNTFQPINWWAYGGYRCYTNQKAVRYSDWGETGAGTIVDDVIKSQGAPGETFYVKFPRLNAIQELRVGTDLASSTVWSEVADLSTVSSTAEVFAKQVWDGRIKFGDGIHGKKLPADDYVFVTYETGWRAGFVSFYKQMKAVDPSIVIANSHYNILSEYSGIVAAGADMDAYQVHAADESYAKPPAGADYLDQLIGTAYFGIPKKIEQGTNALANAGLPVGTEVLLSEYGFGSSWDSSLGLAHGRTIIGALAEGAAFTRIVSEFGSETDYPVTIAQMNYMDRGGAAPMDMNGVVAGMGLTQLLISGSYGYDQLESVPTLNPVRSLVWQGLNWQNTPQVESIPKVLVGSATDSYGNLYILSVNTTAAEVMSVTVDIANGFPLTGRPLSSKTIKSDSLTTINTPANPAGIRIESDADPMDVIFWDEDTLHFPVDPLTVRMIKVENYQGAFHLESMDYPGLWLQSTAATVNALVEVTTAGSGNAAQWNVIGDGSGWYRITNVAAAGMPLMPNGSQVGKKLKIGASGWIGDWTQWELKHIGGNVYRPLNKAIGLPFKPDNTVGGSSVVNTDATDYSNMPRWRLLKAQ